MIPGNPSYIWFPSPTKPRIVTPFDSMYPITQAGENNQDDIKEPTFKKQYVPDGDGFKAGIDSQARSEYGAYEG